MNTGGLEKVRIYSYTDKNLTSESSGVSQPFYLPVNPENYSKNFKVETDNRAASGDEGSDPRYIRTQPEELKLEFILDGTGAIENYRYTDPEKKSVKDQFELFLLSVYRMDGDIHRPNFLKVHWGEYLTFPCILSNLDINYQLFEAGGDPLRMKISATFLDYKSKEEREARSRRNSPDLTHVKETKAGDRLDLLTHDIYNDTKYLLQIAEKNGLTSFRRLDSGMKLHFYPLKTGDTP